MTAPNPPAMAKAIVAALRNVDVRAVPFEPEAEWPVPCVIVPPPSLEQITPAIWRNVYELLYVVSSADDRAAHLNLGADLARIKAGLEADQTLGGEASGCWVRSVRPDDEIRDRTSGFWFGARFDFEVHT